MKEISFDRFAGWAATFVGIGGLAYAVLFAYIVAGAPTWVEGVWLLFLTLGGVVSIVVTVAVYMRLRATDEGFALVSLLLGFAGALGGVVHGAYHLANVIEPSRTAGGASTSADPLGVLRYAAAGLALLIVAWLILRGGRLPRGLAYLGSFGGAVLVFIYVGRLFDFITPTNRISLVPPFLYGFVVHPIWYVWMGRELRRA